MTSLDVIVAFLTGAVVAAMVLWPNDRLALWWRARRDAGIEDVAYTGVSHENDDLRELFDATLEAYPHPVFVTDRSRVILFANAAALSLVALPRAQVVRRMLATVIQDYDTTRLLMKATHTQEVVERTFQRAATGQTWRVRVTPLKLSFSSVSQPAISAKEGMTTHLVLAIEDLTELRRLETVRSDFVSHVSHELRTPLAALKLLNETLIPAIGTAPTAAQDFAVRAGVEIDHLSQLVTELLELSRIESGKIRLKREPTELEGLIEVTLDRMRPLAEERGIALQAMPPAERLPDALIDGMRIGEVLVNLIHNAIKYTPDGGTVTVSAVTMPESAVAKESRPQMGEKAHEADAQPDSTPEVLVVRVADTGIGIDEEDLPRVFERFFKADRARTRVTGRQVLESGAEAGTGLGLAIAKHLVELHGGRIWAESRIGYGSVFSFSVPMALGEGVEDTSSLSRTGVVS